MTELSLKQQAARHALSFPNGAMGVVISDGVVDDFGGLPMIWTGEISRGDHQDKPEIYHWVHPITGDKQATDAACGTLWISDGAPFGVAMFVAKCWREWDSHQL